MGTGLFFRERGLSAAVEFLLDGLDLFALLDRGLLELADIRLVGAHVV